MAKDADFNRKHPRANGGRFTAKTTGSTAPTPAPAAQKASAADLQASGWRPGVDLTRIDATHYMIGVNERGKDLCRHTFLSRNGMGAGGLTKVETLCTECGRAEIWLERAGAARSRQSRRRR